MNSQQGRGAGGVCPLPRKRLGVRHLCTHAVKSRAADEGGKRGL